MKTHPESVWINKYDVARSISKKYRGYVFDATVTGHESKVCEEGLEFVPASVYLELKTELEKVNTQLDIQTANMVKLREFVERIANDELDEHGDSLVCSAQDLIMELSR